MSECEHGTPGGAMGGCPPCQGSARERTPTPLRAFAARYVGECRGCGGPIGIGESIVALDREWGAEYRHDDAACVPEETRHAG